MTGRAKNARLALGGRTTYDLRPENASHSACLSMVRPHGAKPALAWHQIICSAPLMAPGRHFRGAYSSTMHPHGAIRALSER